MEQYDKSLQYISNTQTLIGSQRKRLQDLDTGEVTIVDQITKRAYGQKQFWKVYLMDFLTVLGVLDSKQVDVLIYILENTEPANNTFIGSQRDIATKCNVSLDTVSRIMCKLQKANFIKQIKRSVYQVSATIMMKGTEHKKQLLINYYDDTENQSIEEKAGA